MESLTVMKCSSFVHAASLQHLSWNRGDPLPASPQSRDPQPLGLMSDDLSWSFVVEIKCAISVMHLNHPETLLCPASVEQLSSMKLVPGAKKVGELLTQSETSILLFISYLSGKMINITATPILLGLYFKFFPFPQRSSLSRLEQ